VDHRLGVGLRDHLARLVLGRLLRVGRDAGWRPSAAPPGAASIVPRPWYRTNGSPSFCCENTW
jgi:hypothetical protein